MTGWIIALALYILGASEQLTTLLKLRKQGDHELPLWYPLLWPLTAIIRSTMKE